MPSPARKRTQAADVPPTERASTAPLEHKRIARLAYSYWEARGRRLGSPEEDWFRAEEELRRRKADWTIVKGQRLSARRPRRNP